MDNHHKQKYRSLYRFSKFSISINFNKLSGFEYVGDNLHQEIPLNRKEANSLRSVMEALLKKERPARVPPPNKLAKVISKYC